MPPNTRQYNEKPQIYDSAKKKTLQDLSGAFVYFQPRKLRKMRQDRKREEIRRKRRRRYRICRHIEEGCRLAFLPADPAESCRAGNRNVFVLHLRGRCSL